MHFKTLEFKPMDMVIVLLNQKHQAIVRWNVIHAWPKSWKFDELNAEQGKVYIETLEFELQFVPHV